MPDRNGVPTLRDRFPLRCVICKQIIVSAQYDANGVLVTADEDYRVIGVARVPTINVNEAPIPICVYRHLNCIGT